MDLTACQLIGSCYAETNYVKNYGKKRQNIIPSADPNLNIVRFKVCIGDLTNNEDKTDSWLDHDSLLEQFKQADIEM